MSKEKKPNIVFAFADDWGRYASIYSKYENVAPLTSSVNEFIHTPNFDRVAKEGVLFLNALVPAPSCTPCRSSVLSGRYFWQTGLGAKLYTPSTLNIDFIQWHTQLIMCAVK